MTACARAVSFALAAGLAAAFATSCIISEDVQPLPSCRDLEPSTANGCLAYCERLHPEGSELYAGSLSECVCKGSAAGTDCIRNCGHSICNPRPSLPRPGCDTEELYDCADCLTSACQVSCTDQACNDFALCLSNCGGP